MQFSGVANLLRYSFLNTSGPFIQQAANLEVVTLALLSGGRLVARSLEISQPGNPLNDP